MRCSNAISPVVVLQPEVIRHFGTSTAAFLSQLNYWIQRNKSGVIHKGMRWIFNTAEEWSCQIGVSDRQIRRIVAELKNAGVIFVEKLADYKSNRTNYYTINYERLSELLAERQIPQNVLSMSESSGQDVLMVKTKITNRTINKSNKSKYYCSYRIKRQTLDASELLNPATTEKSEKLEGIEVKSPPAPILSYNEAVKNTTAQDMIDYWNSVFPKSKTPMSRNLAKRLVAAFKVKFETKMWMWKNYCQLIESSNYLTGSNFKLSLLWALKYQTIDRIRAGELGVKDIKYPSEYYEEKALHHLKYVQEEDICKEIRFKLLKHYGAMVYNSWFTRISFTPNDGQITFKADNKFIEEYVVSNFPEILISRKFGWLKSLTRNH